MVRKSATFKGKKPKINDRLAKLTAKQFKGDVAVFEKAAADEFIKRVTEKYKKASSTLNVINQLLDVKVTTDDLKDHLELKDHMVFIDDNKIVGQITYKEFFAIMEHGRKDVGILPNPILKKEFDDFRDDYKKGVKNFLMGKPFFK